MFACPGTCCIGRCTHMKRRADTAPVRLNCQQCSERPTLVSLLKTISQHYMEKVCAPSTMQDFTTTHIAGLPTYWTTCRSSVPAGLMPVSCLRHNSRQTKQSASAWTQGSTDPRNGRYFQRISEKSTLIDKAAILASSFTVMRSA